MQRARYSDLETVLADAWRLEKEQVAHGDRSVRDGGKAVDRDVCATQGPQ